MTPAHLLTKLIQATFATSEIGCQSMVMLATGGARAPPVVGDATRSNQVLSNPLTMPLAPRHPPPAPQPPPRSTAAPAAHKLERPMYDRQVCNNKDFTPEVQQHGQSAPLAAPQLAPCASSGRAWWLWAACTPAACTPAGRSLATGAPRHCLGFSSDPPPKPADITAFVAPCRRGTLTLTLSLSRRGTTCATRASSA